MYKSASLYTLQGRFVDDVLGGPQALGDPSEECDSQTCFVS